MNRGSDLLERLSRRNREHRWLTAGDMVLVALSGGLDSTALLDLLVRFGKRIGFRVQAATVDHGLRPFSLELDATAALCSSLGVQHHVLKLPPGLAGRADACGASLQEQARNERYAILWKTAQSVGAGRIATAHHADDQAETLLLRLASGAGLDGLAGVRSERADGVVRPLLGFRRRELDAYVRQRNLRFVEDPTNRSERFVRNRVRSRVLPVLEEVLPAAVIGMARCAALLAEEGAVVDSLLDDCLDRARSGDGNAQENGVIPESTQPRRRPEAVGQGVRAAALGVGALRRMLLHRWLSRQGLRHSASHLHALERLLDRKDGGSASIDLPGGATAWLEYGLLRLVRNAPAHCAARDGEGNDVSRLVIAPGGRCERSEATAFSVEIGGPGTIGIPAGSLVVKHVASWNPGQSEGPLAAAFAAAGPVFPLVVRSPGRGDRIVPHGGRGSRLVSDLVAEARIPRRLRLSVGVVLDASGCVLWIAGLRKTALYSPVDGEPALVLVLVPE